MFNVSKQISLSSKTATTNNYPLNSKCYFEMPNMMKRTEDIKIVTLGISHCEIPVSFYIINNNNNSLILNINNGGETTYQFVNGNYNATTFQTMLLNILPANFSIYLNTSTGKFTLSNSLNAFYISRLSTCYNLLGLNKNSTTDYYSIYNTITTKFDIICPYPCNFLGTSRLSIKSTSIQTSNLDSNAGGHSSSLATISNTAELFGIILFNNNNNFKNVVYNDFLNGIDIGIYDENDNLVDMNGIHWTITLELNEYIDISNNLSPSLTKFMGSKN
jgi:hypothetical protein